MSRIDRIRCRLGFHRWQLLTRAKRVERDGWIQIRDEACQRCVNPLCPQGREWIVMNVGYTKIERVKAR